MLLNMKTILFALVLVKSKMHCFVYKLGQMYSMDPGAEPQTYGYTVPEEIRRFIHFFHQHVTEQVS